MSVIHPENIVNKLCFATQGGADTLQIKALRQQLVKTATGCKSKGIPSPSRAMIHNWTTGSVPTREMAFTFIHEFVNEFRESGEEFNHISQEQKKVLGQIRNYCTKRKQTDKKSNAIHGAFGRSIVIEQSRIFSPNQIFDEIEYFPGIYNLYRNRFGSSDTGRVAVEVLKIQEINNQLYATWWFLIDDFKLHKFEGMVVFVGTCLWIFVHNPSLSGRLRALCLDRTGWGRTRRQVHTGVLLSTTPDYRAPAPAACRVFVERVERPSKVARLRDFVYFTSEDAFKHPMKNEILEMIENEQSVPGILAADLDGVKRAQE